MSEESVPTWAASGNSGVSSSSSLDIPIDNLNISNNNSDKQQHKISIQGGIINSTGSSNSMKRASSSKNKQMGGTSQAEIDETADRTQQIANRLKEIYATSVHPVEKRYRYDYFFESPYLTNVEFDGTSCHIYLFFETKKSSKMIFFLHHCPYVYFLPHSKYIYPYAFSLFFCLFSFFS